VKTTSVAAKTQLSHKPEQLAFSYVITEAEEPPSRPLFEKSNEEEPPGKRASGRHQLFGNVPDSSWNDWKWQFRNRIVSVDQLKKLVSFSPEVSERIHLDHVENDHDSPLIFLIFLILTALSGPVYFGASIKLFKTLDINIFNNFSYSENINLDWLRKLVYIFGFVWTLLVIITSLHHVFHVFSWIFCTNGIFLALSIFVILIGYFGLKQKEIFAYQGKDSYVIKQKTEKYSGSGLKDSDARHYLEILTNYMAVEKPYLDPNLNLPQLAKDINIPIHYLSQIINEKLHNNFFNYINQFRVEEVKSKIFDPKFENYSLLGIAMDSGFNSKSVFNRIFKKYTNQTPSQFKASLSKR